jgi:hypothetical protein
MRQLLNDLENLIGEAKAGRGLARRSRSKVTKNKTTKKAAGPGQFPAKVTYKGNVFWATNEKSTDSHTDKPIRKYKIDIDAVWVDEDGNVFRAD